MTDTIDAADYAKVARKGSKYGNVITEAWGHRFDSKAEARRFEQLRLMEMAGKIDFLELQPKFRIEVNGVLICTYVADFRYFGDRGKWVVEDVKSKPTMTAAYRLKKKLVKAIHGIDVIEVMP